MSSVHGGTGHGRRGPMAFILKERRSWGGLVALALLVAGCAGVDRQQARREPAGHPPGAGAQRRYQPDRFAGRAGRYYRLVWGVDSLSVKLVESGELVRFGWRVLDPQKARVLGDKRLEPSLVDPQAGVSLVVPTMEKIGQLREATEPEAGTSYWMTFSNKGRKVKRGDRVGILIGEFRAEGLVVD